MNTVGTFCLCRWRGYFYRFNDLGQGLGPLLMGLIATSNGFSAMYLSESGIVAFSIALYYILHGRFAR
jgi:hypothetical protein